MSINIFNHPYKTEVNRQLEPIIRSLRRGDSIKAIHTPIVLPFATSEVGDCARSLELPFCGKWIALNCGHFEKENDSMKKFILGRQVALFDKPSRYLHNPLAAIVTAIGFVVSSILFSSPITLVGATTLVATISAHLIAKKEQENAKYADVIAFRNCQDIDKKIILDVFKAKEEKERNTPRSFLKHSFSSYPSYRDRYNQLVNDRHTNIGLQNLYPHIDGINNEEALEN